MSVPASPPVLPPDLRTRVLDAARRAPAPSRAAGSRRRGLTIALGFCVAVACALWVGKLELGGRPGGYLALVFVAWAAIAVVASWGALGRGRLMLGRPTAYKVAIALLTPAALISVALVGSLVWPETVDGRSGLVAHVVCAALTVLFALGPLVSFALVSRHTDPIAPTLSGAALGAAAGAWGAFGIELFCSRATPVHVALGHVLPVVLLAAAGALVGGRLVRVVAVRGKNG